MRLRNGKIVGTNRTNDKSEQEDEESKEHDEDQDQPIEESKEEATHPSKESRTEAIIKVMRQTLTEEEE